MKKFYLMTLLSLVCLLVVEPTVAQNTVKGTVKGTVVEARTITGTIVDEAGEPMPSVTVLVTGTQIGTVTDLDGKYTIEVPAGSNSLTYSFVGFNSQKVELGASNVIDLTMSEGLDLDEVVVTALGITKEKKALGYAVQEVQGEDLATSGKANVVQGLQGRIAGVRVNQGSGTPGASASIKIRGSSALGTYANNQPLFVVDGVPIDNSYTESGNPDDVQNNFLNGVDVSNRAVDINPNDIESVNVLKGAAAAALYGLRAANGVVVITTKAGARNQDKVKVDVNISSSWEKPSVLPSVQQSYAQGAGGTYNNGTSLSWGPKISEIEGTITNAIGEEVMPQIYDNITPFFDTGRLNEQAVSISGGNNIADYYVSFGNYTHKGILPTSTFNRRTGKLSGSVSVTPKFRIGGSVNYANSGGNRIQQGSNLANPLFTVYPAPITFDLHGLPFENADDPYTQVHYRTRFDNPYWSNKHNSFTDNTNRMFGNINMEYKPLDWITIKYTLGTDFFIERRKEVLSKGSGATAGRTSPPSGGSIAERSVFGRKINSDFLVTANRKLTDDLDLSILVGQNVFSDFSQDLYTKGTDISIGGFDNINNTSNQLVRESIGEKLIIGAFGGIDLAYKNMLYFGLTGRADWSSALPKKNLPYFYPAVNLGFVFSELIDNNSILSYGKIRGSWAQVGNDAAAYSTTTVFVAPTPGSGFITGTTFPFDGVNAFTAGNVLGNPDLEPQNQTSWEIGGDFRFLQNKVGLDITYYNSVTKNQIFQVPGSPASGVRSRILNAGEVSNKGLEFTLNLTPVKSRDFAWNLSFNYAANRGEVVELADGVDAIDLGGFASTNTRLLAGQPYSVLWGTPYVRDDNDNIIIDDRPLIGGAINPFYGMPVASPTQGIIGNTQADWTGGLTNSFTYKNFSLDIHCTIRKGGQMYAGNTRLLKLYGQDPLTERREDVVVLEGVKGHLDPATNELISSGATNDIAIRYGQDFWLDANDAIDEANIYEASFFRVSEVTLSYRFDQGLLDRTPLSGLEVFFKGNNLLLFSNYPNFDPETNLGGASNFEGFEYMNMPNVRRFGLGLRASF